VAAVELADGQQVQRGHQEAEPAREGDGIQYDTIRLDAEDEPGEPGREERVAERHAGAGGRRVEHARAGEAQHGDDDRHHRAGPRTGGAHVEKGPAVGKRRADADEGAEGAGQDGARHRRPGQEVG
jgi:hypothetical protein